MYDISKKVIQGVRTMDFDRRNLESWLNSKILNVILEIPLPNNIT